MADLIPADLLEKILIVAGSIIVLIGVLWLMIKNTSLPKAKYNAADEDQSDLLMQNKGGGRFNRMGAPAKAGHRLSEALHQGIVQENTRAWAGKRIAKSEDTQSHEPKFSRLGGQPPAKAKVDCSVFAPPVPIASADFVVQAFLHKQTQLMAAARQASERDKSANRLGFASLSMSVSDGQEIELFLDCPELEIDQVFQSITWHGKPAFCDFVVRFRDAEIQTKKVSSVLHVSIEGVPIGEIEFSLYPKLDEKHDRERLKMVAAPSLSPPQRPNSERQPLGDRADRYRNAFVSYSRKDFEKVAFFAEGLSENGIKLFFDVNSIDRGDDWLERIETNIPETDIFYLMWSSNAAASNMVTEECRLATEHAAKNERKQPKIKPVTLHRKAPQPPKFLSHLHFDSQWLAHREAQKSPLFE